MLNNDLNIFRGVNSMKKAILPVEYKDEQLNKTESFEEYRPSSSQAHTPNGAYGTNIVLVG